MWSPLQGIDTCWGQVILPKVRTGTIFPERYVCSVPYKTGFGDPIENPSLDSMFSLSGMFHSAPMSRDEFKKSMNKYFCEPPKYDKSRMQESLSYLHFHFSKYLVGSNTLEWEDVVDLPNGGSGYPENRRYQKKRDLIQGPNFADELDMCAGSNIQQNIISAFAKRELLPVDKQYPRAIMPDGFVKYFRDRRFLYVLNEKLKASSPFHGIFIGTGIFNMQWHKRCVRIDKHKNGFGGDYHWYDGMSTDDLLHLIDRFYMEMVVASLEEKIHWAYSRLCSLVNYILDVDGCIYRTYAKFPTGCFDTAMTNSFRCICKLFFFFNILIRKRRPFIKLETIMDYFDKFVVFEILGDDWNVSVDDHVAEWFNPKTVAEVAASQGFDLVFSFVNVVIPHMLPFCGVWTREENGLFIPVSDMVKMVDSFLLRVKKHHNSLETLKSEFSKLCSLRILAYSSPEYFRVIDGECIRYILHYDEVYGHAHPVWNDIKANYIVESEVRKLYFSYEGVSIKNVAPLK